MPFRQATYDEPLISEMRSGSTYRIPGDASATVLKDLPGEILRKDLKLPEVSEYDVVRHYTRLSQMNYSVDLGIYPLGSCTMKFNPKLADLVSTFEGFSGIHPLQSEETVQGSLKIMYELQEYLKDISDMDAITLQPLAGAHGEFTGILIVRKYHEDRGDLGKRTEIIIPDSAHGTNPASAAMCGFDVVEIPSGPNGTVNIEALKAALSEKTAAFMITNPNTLGIFEDQITEIAKLVHDAGALLYYDGANFNAILGITSPGLMGFDIVHFNLHKTFATPHGGGGPGSGPVAVKAHLKDFLPVPVVSMKDKRYFLDYSMKKTIGKVSSYFGSFNMLLRAWSYIKYHGWDGLNENTLDAVMNANYLSKKLSAAFRIPYKPLKKHELVLSTEGTGKKALDLAKYLIDQGVHAPTVYFPLIVHEAMMIEPTETVSKADLDNFAEMLLKSLEVEEEELKKMPRNLSVGRLDEVKAARDLKIRWD
ncbi:MAG: aminomethyl-transferring glycine dehydrogenase subunit GcvPB [Candidatus Thermoplasmatota archaeon]|nr:aminomethyl-transferring glycine dehydrogenase subunit GcvPB [Candidatus Thermoplasmatota archaeon]